MKTRDTTMEDDEVDNGIVAIIISEAYRKRMYSIFDVVTFPISTPEDDTQTSP
jgi:hypothetical protein